MEASGLVLDILRFSLHDGPGIRTTVFFKGCPMQCQWCHNPESWRPCPEIAYFEERCTHCASCTAVCPTGCQQIRDGIHQFSRDLCSLCYACTEVCPYDALRKAGKEMKVMEVLNEVDKDRAYYEESGGGITLSGGEPLMQPVFAREILWESKRRGIHTCIETSGYASENVLQQLVPFTDLVLFDYKASHKKHQRLTAVDNQIILKNLRFLNGLGVPLELRCPIIPGLNDSGEDFQSIADLSAEFNHRIPVRIMPYHDTGNAKRARFGYLPGMDGIPSMDEKTCEKLKNSLSGFGVKYIL
jgi:glycyl-radical enzyme activating protein